jgi:benzoate membrane transport protein
VFLQFGLDWVHAFAGDLTIAASMTAAFLAVSALPRLARWLPPLIVALAAGVAVMHQTGALTQDLSQVPLLAAPVFHMPELSWGAMVELVVPLAITVLVVQNGQGFAVLTAAGHAPPVDRIAVGCGAATLAGAIVGAVPTCLTGPVNAIISGSGEARRQYTAGIAVGVLGCLFGLLSPTVTRLLLATPAAFIATLAGLAMLRVLQSAFAIAFRDRCALGALVAFLVTVADIALAGIGAPFWGLLFGVAVTLLLERGDLAVG